MSVRDDIARVLEGHPAKEYVLRSVDLYAEQVAARRVGEVLIDLVGKTPEPHLDPHVTRPHGGQG